MARRLRLFFLGLAKGGTGIDTGGVCLTGCAGGNWD